MLKKIAETYIVKNSTGKTVCTIDITLDEDTLTWTAPDFTNEQGKKLSHQDRGQLLSKAMQNLKQNKHQIRELIKQELEDLSDVIKNKTSY